MDTNVRQFQPKSEIRRSKPERSPKPEIRRKPDPVGSSLIPSVVDPDSSRRPQEPFLTAKRRTDHRAAQAQPNSTLILQLRLASGLRISFGPRTSDFGFAAPPREPSSGEPSVLIGGALSVIVPVGYGSTRRESKGVNNNVALMGLAARRARRAAHLLVQRRLAPDLD